ncbi:MAG: chemotaxis protein CheW [bacterium]|nr:chemotaxis protein CheW [bacterium]MDT8364859.1 chemotaxis protein CheW [bacterium]
MDLVEIRKKAKSRKPKGRKVREKPDNTVEETALIEEQPPVPLEDVDSPDPGDLPEEIVTSEEAVPMDSEKATSVVEVEEIPETLTSLDDVFMSQRKEVKEEEEEQLQLLTFKLGGEEYALNIMDIKEIIRPKEATEVPRTPDFILGIFSLRGTIIPVFDVSLRLGLPRGERGSQNRIVVVKSRENFFGLYVDSVVQVLDIPLSKIEPPPEILGGVEGEFLRGIGRIDDRLIILLNLEIVLRLDDGEGSGNLKLPSGE